jgi:hypothetical protein
LDGVGLGVIVEGTGEGVTVGGISVEVGGIGVGGTGDTISEAGLSRQGGKGMLP